MLQMNNNLQNNNPQDEGEYKNQLLIKLNETVTEVRAELDKGLQPDEYSKADKLLKAIEAAIYVVEQEE